MIDPIQWFVSLFTPPEWKALALLIGVTLAGTHTGKVVWRALPVRGGGTESAVLLAALIGFVVSYFVWPIEPKAPWWVIGIIAGPLSNLAFFVGFGLLKRFSPETADAINFNRRKAENPLPPVGTGERRQR